MFKAIEILLLVLVTQKVTAIKIPAALEVEAVSFTFYLLFSSNALPQLNHV